VKRVFFRLCKFFLLCFCVLLLFIGFEAFRSWRCELQGQLHPSLPRAPQCAEVTAGIKYYSRAEDDAFLGYPEWYIVWSYQEKADFQEKDLPSGFPYFASIRQYWGSYCCVSRLIRGKYPYNGGGHLMLAVIGTSFSAEYILKGAYEKTIGRLSEWSSGHQSVEEDVFAYRVAREYADFVHVRPFYEFHFAHQTKQLWKATPFWGPHLLRKWERKLFLTADFTVEAFYSWVLEKASHITYGVEPANTYAWIDHVSDTLFQQQTRIKKVKQVDSSSFIVDIPRYQEFTSVASVLTAHGVRFVEIAGNMQISLSVIAPATWHYSHGDATTLFSAPVLINPRLNRVILACDVSSLHTVLAALSSDNVALEHIYDY
jgi:hypothetical protein